MKYDAIIVGGGVAGLTAAAYLSKAGKSILLCEKENKCGGLINSFERDGFVFDGGIRALENAGALFPMMRQLGIKIDFVKSHVSMGIEDQVIRLESDESVNTYSDLLTSFYPESSEEIAAIIADIRKIMKYMDVQYGIDNPIFLDMKADRDYLVKKVLPWMIRYANTIRKIMAITQPLEAYLKKFSNNQSLLDIISQHFFTQTPAFFALSYIKLYLDYYYPMGGTGVLVEKLLELIKNHGGEIRTGTEIISVNLPKRSISDKNGNCYEFNQLLWAADMKRLYQCIDCDAILDTTLRKIVLEQRDELSDLEGNNSIFTLYLTSSINTDYFSNIATEHFFYTPRRDGQSRAGQMPLNGSKQEISSWLERYLALTTYEISIPALRDSRLAPKGKTGLIISCLFDYKLSRKIKENGWYEQFKELAEKLIIQTLDRTIYPGLAKSVLDKFSSTPITLEETTGNTGGAITGWAFTNKHIPAENRLHRIANAVNTPLPNVLQAGQWTFSPSGLPISLITGKMAADKILKMLKK